MHTFSYAVQSAWNTLLRKIRSSNMFSSFGSSLKTRLFKLSY